MEYKEYEPALCMCKECSRQTRNKGRDSLSHVTLMSQWQMVLVSFIIAPAFGEDDANVGRNYDPAIQYSS